MITSLKCQLAFSNGSEMATILRENEFISEFFHANNY